MQSSHSLDLLRPVALGIGIFAATGAIGAAQNSTGPCTSPQAAWNSFDSSYDSVSAWQPTWDTGKYDRNHVLLGTVGSFAPFRLTLTSQQGDTMVVDLKQGTIIRPTGSTPSAGQRVAVFGYWSNGTFVADRLVLHG
jgi:hypothetical protein